jgi:hypothetical protein
MTEVRGRRGGALKMFLHFLAVIIIQAEEN